MAKKIDPRTVDDFKDFTGDGDYGKDPEGDAKKISELLENLSQAADAIPDKAVAPPGAKDYYDYSVPGALGWGGPMPAPPPLSHASPLGVDVLPQLQQLGQGPGATTSFPGAQQTSAPLPFAGAPAPPGPPRDASGTGMGGNRPPGPPQPPAPPGNPPTPPTPPSPQGGGGQGQLMALLGKMGSQTDAGGSPEGVGVGELGQAAQMTQTVARAAAGDPVAIAQTAKMAIDDLNSRKQAMMDGLKGMGMEAFKSLHSDKAQDVGAGLFGGGEKMAGGTAQAFQGSAFGEMAANAEKVMAFGRQVMEAVGALREWNGTLTENNLKFSEFSASMARVQAIQEVNEIRLSRERGDRRAETAEALVDSTNQLDRKLAPIEDAWANMGNMVASVIATALGRAIPDFNENGKDRFTGGLGEELINEGSWGGTVRGEEWYKNFGENGARREMR